MALDFPGFFESVGGFLFGRGLLPHGMCFLWKPEILWLHVISDLVIGLSYYSIPVALYVFVRKRTDLEFGSIFQLFAAFIFLCGSTHFLSIFVNWQPYYAIEGVLKFLTAGVSAVTAIVIWPLIPKALALPSPARLRGLNVELERQVASRRQAEARLWVTNDSLESLVARRTRDLAEANAGLVAEIERRKTIEAELALARQNAEAANRAKSSFLAAMGHEIRTPLNAILGIAQATAQQVDASMVEKNLAIITESGQTLQNILNDLLDYSKIEAGHVSIVAARTNLTEFIGSKRELWAPQAAAKSLRLLTRSNVPLDQHVMVDSHRLSQILDNLLSNAVKYSSGGVVELSVDLNDDASGRTILSASVRDEGIGIARDLWPFLFKPFEQLSEDRARKFGGTGLGLAISQRLAQLMQGEIRFESEPGVGSCFTLTIPIARLDSGQVNMKAQKGDDHGTPACRVLAVDDNAANRMVMEQLLGALHQNVQLASSGREALAMLDAQPYDVVLLDLRMPEIDGFDVIARLRAGTSRNKDIPVYAVTANSRSEITRDLGAAGFNGYVGKPIDIRQLRSLLKSAAFQPAMAAH